MWFKLFLKLHFFSLIYYCSGITNKFFIGHLQDHNRNAIRIDSIVQYANYRWKAQWKYQDCLFWGISNYVNLFSGCCCWCIWSNWRNHSWWYAYKENASLFTFFSLLFTFQVYVEYCTVHAGTKVRVYCHFWKFSLDVAVKALDIFTR